MIHRTGLTLPGKILQKLVGWDKPDRYSDKNSSSSRAYINKMHCCALIIFPSEVAPQRLQVGFGSGFKCNSTVWRALRPIHNERHEAWAHMKTMTTAPMWESLKAPVPDKSDSKVAAGVTAKLNGVTPSGESVSDGIPAQKAV